MNKCFHHTPHNEANLLSSPCRFPCPDRQHREQLRYNIQATHLYLLPKGVRAIRGRLSDSFAAPMTSASTRAALTMHVRPSWRSVLA